MFSRDNDVRSIRALLTITIMPIIRFSPHGSRIPAYKGVLYDCEYVDNKVYIILYYIILYYRNVGENLRIDNVERTGIRDTMQIFMPIVEAHDQS